MSRWTEGVLALVIVLAFGLAMQLFVGDTPGTGPTTPGTETPTPSDPEAAARGLAVMETVGCLLCHTIDGTQGSAPTFKGLAGASRPLESGEFVTADDAYLLNSIIDPGSQIVQGFPNLMPADFEESLTPAQIDDIIAYIRSLAS